MLQEILGITTITLYSLTRKEMYKQKILDLTFNLFLYGGLYNLTLLDKNLHEEYLFFTPILFGIATITDYLKTKEQKNYELKNIGSNNTSLEEKIK